MKLLRKTRSLKELQKLVTMLATCFKADSVQKIRNGESPLTEFVYHTHIYIALGIKICIIMCSLSKIELTLYGPGLNNGLVSLVRELPPGLAVVFLATWSDQTRRLLHEGSASW